MKPFAYQGEVTQEPVAKMRAMTLTGLCLFLDISDDTWRNYRSNEDLLGVVSRAEKVIYDQKFSGAAADLLNANIIARDLGLAEKKEVKQSVSDLSDEEIERRIKELNNGQASTTDESPEG